MLWLNLQNHSTITSKHLTSHLQENKTEVEKLSINMIKPTVRQFPLNSAASLHLFKVLIGVIELSSI